MRRLFSLLILALALLCPLAPAAVSAHAQERGGATVTVTPSPVPVGTAFVVQGCNLHQGQSYFFAFNDGSSDYLTPDATGCISYTHAPQAIAGHYIADLDRVGQGTSGKFQIELLFAYDVV